MKDPGKICSNQALVGLSFIPVSVTIILLALWQALNPVYTDYEIPISQQKNDIKLLAPICGANITSIILIVTITYGANGIPIIAVGILATLTRNVKFNIFKDSKQVNTFVFLTIVSLCIWLPYSLIFIEIRIYLPEVETLGVLWLLKRAL